MGRFDNNIIINDDGFRMQSQKDTAKGRGYREASWENQPAV